MANDNGINYALPATDDAPRICVTLSIPGDEESISNFVGALSTLALWKNYRRDALKRGTIIADVWKQIVQDIAFTECNIPIKTRTIYLEEEPMPICTQLRWNNGVLEGLCCFNPETCEMEWVAICGAEDGLIPSGTITPSSGSRPDPGDSKCKNYTLKPGESYIIPFGLQADDVVTVSNRQGAWSSNGIAWNCTDGTPFVLGQCSGTPYHDGGDPDGTLYHGQLMLQIAGQNLSLTDGPVTLSGFSGQQQGIIIGNMTPSFGAGGTIGFTVCVESGEAPPPSEWCHYLDFTLSNYGLFTTFLDWVVGVGFRATGAADCHIVITGTEQFTITSATFYFSAYSTDPDTHGVGIATSGGDFECGVDEVEAAIVNQVLPCTPDLDTVKQLIFQSISSPLTTLTAVELRGSGVSPFGTDNC